MAGATGEALGEVEATPAATLEARAALMGTAPKVAGRAAEGWAEVRAEVGAAEAREVAASVAGSRCSTHHKSAGKQGDRGASAGAQTTGALPHVSCDLLAYICWIAN